MQKIDKLAHAVKVVGLRLPPVVISLITALSPKKKGAVSIHGRRPAPMPGAARSSGTG